ncbi:MAG TPA: hypothetical protein VMI31_15495 [Fimbriimonadaceae bacterium]|nr:hypothetical protein [Fimbriimonadaceae bacterium]
MLAIGIELEKKDFAFLMANGQTVTRSVGFATIRIGDRFTSMKSYSRRVATCCCSAPVRSKV